MQPMRWHQVGGLPAWRSASLTRPATAPLALRCAAKGPAQPYVRGDYDGKLYAGHPAFEWVLAAISSITTLKVRRRPPGLPAGLPERL